MTHLPHRAVISTWCHQYTAGTHDRLSDKRRHIIRPQLHDMVLKFIGKKLSVFCLAQVLRPRWSPIHIGGRHMRNPFLAGTVKAVLGGMYPCQIGGNIGAAVICVVPGNNLFLVRFAPEIIVVMDNPDRRVDCSRATAGIEHMIQ